MTRHFPFFIFLPLYSTQINTLLTRGLISAILNGELTNEDNVAKWIDEHHTSEIPINGYMVPD